MDSLVIELQRGATSSNTSASSLLRHALLVASKLDLSDFEEWTRNELHGYEGKVPQYRMIVSSIVLKNPYRGLTPLVWPSSEFEQKCTRFGFGAPISVVQDNIALGLESGFVHMSVSADLESALRKSTDFMGMEMLQVVAASEFAKIVDAVRTTVLQWSLKLEKAGILGEGMTFNPEEKAKAAGNRSIHIQNFQGILGDVLGSVVSQNLRQTVKINDVESLRSALAALGVSDDDLSNLNTAIESDGKMTKSGGFGPRVSDWLGRLTEKAASGASKVALSVVTTFVIDAIKKYYGM